MSLKSRLLKAENSLHKITHEQSAARRQHILECLMRFGLVHNHLKCVIPLGHKTREEMTDEEWSDFITRSVAYFNRNQWFHREDRTIGHICRITFGVPESALPQLMEAFISLPSASDYGYEPI
ncbi:MAG: hypothetical protein M3362_27485 [Acidobacteriota bacterium]|nr:hypothetical protein [Acidobacteriota bacterium]